MRALTLRMKPIHAAVTAVSSVSANVSEAHGKNLWPSFISQMRVKKNKKPKRRNRRTKKNRRTKTRVQAEMVKLVHKLGAHLDAVDENGRTALIIASCKGYIDVLQVLHEAKADLNVRDKKGRTAVFAAVKNGHTDMLKVQREGATVVLSQPND